VKVRWTPQSERDRRDVHDYIASDNPLAAARMDELFGAAAAKLAEFPEMGRIGSVPGTRELIPHESYRFVYEVKADTVWIVALVHTARRWPPTAG